MPSSLIQIKASGLMCSFCTMTVEKALGRLPSDNSVFVQPRQHGSRPRAGRGRHVQGQMRGACCKVWH